MPSGFIYKNTDEDNPTLYKQKYAIEGGHGGEWHIYESGHKVWVAGSHPTNYSIDAANNIINQDASQDYIAAHPPVPVAATPAQATSTPSTSPPIDTSLAGGASPTPAPAATTTFNLNKIADRANGGDPISTPPANNQGLSGYGQVPTPPTPASALGTAQAVSAPSTTSPSTTPAIDTSLAGGASPTPPTSGTVYTVQPNDNLTKIAGAHNMTERHLESLNPQIKNRDVIHPGEKLNLGASPPPTVPAAPLTSGPSTGSNTTEAPHHSQYKRFGGLHHKLKNAIRGKQVGSVGNDSKDVANLAFGGSASHDTDPTKIHHGDHNTA